MALDLIGYKAFGPAHCNVGRGLAYLRISLKVAKW